MVCFFKRIDTFATFGQADVSSYDVPLASAGGQTGTVTVVGELTQDYTRHWLVLQGNLFYITNVAPDGGQTVVTVGDALAAFGRTLVYSEPTTNILGEWIKELAETEYAELDDPAYDMPYLTVTNSDTTTFTPTYPKDGLFTLENVMRDAQSRGISVAFTFSGDAMALNISPGDSQIHALIDGDGHTQLASESYAKTAIAKVTVISALGYPHDYYLSIDGAITTTVPLNRAQGEWVTVKQGEDNLLETATAAFAQNIESHKIELFSDALLPIYANVAVRLKDKLYTSNITYIGVSSTDSRYYYQCGELATTLTEKVANISSIASGMTAPVQSVNGMTGAVKVISDAAPDATSTAAQCLAYAQAHPNVMFTWAKWSAATYTPVQTSASWVYTLYTTYTDASQYTVFEAQNNTDGNLYRCKADGTWVRLAAASEIPDITAWSFTPNNTSTLTSQIDALPASVTFATFYILSSGHQTETGMPVNGNFYGFIFRGSANYVKIVATVVDSSTTIYVRTKWAGTWGQWNTNS